MDFFINFAIQSSFMENKNYQDDLSHIRNMMERSTRFISLSGLSGIFAGLFALLGSAYVYSVFQSQGVNYFDAKQSIDLGAVFPELLITAIVVMIAAITFGIFFTVRKSKRQQLPIWTPSTKRLLTNLFIPLIVGGLFCLGLIYHHYYALLAPATLVFYGLSLSSASQYTYSDIQYLGFAEIALGLMSLIFLGWGLVFWAIGFGILHILYGIVMYKKYQ